MTLYSDPPSLREFKYDKPTLLVCWWAISFCTLIILLRLAGRFIRTERLFTEDRIAALALIPLYLRMGCVHYILLYGTNNADFSGVELTPEQLRRKEIASGLVLASRIFYAATYVACQSPSTNKPFPCLEIKLTCVLQLVDSQKHHSRIFETPNGRYLGPLLAGDFTSHPNYPARHVCCSHH